MLYLIEAKVVVHVQGISGGFNRNVTWLVNANNLNEAKAKFEQKVYQDNAQAMPQSINFEYIKLAGEIK
jgi:hypothetical protein